MTKIVLIVQNQTSSSNFHYAMKTGRPLVMPYDKQRGAHVAKIPLDEWRKDNFRFARNLLDQLLPVPIIFDIEEEAPVVVEIPAPEIPKVKKRRLRRLAPEEKAELEAAMAP